MRQSIVLLLFAMTVCLVAPCFGFQQSSGSSQGFRYPRVYGPSGALYGPTQAHYQYQQRYGRPWHGYGGLTTHGVNSSAHSGIGQGTHYHSPMSTHLYYQSLPCAIGGQSWNYFSSPYGHYPYGATNPWPWTGYPIGYAYTPMAPLVMQGNPLWIGGDPSDNAVMRGAIEEEVRRWHQPIDPHLRPKAKRIPTPSSPDAKLRGIRLQARGDEWMQKQDYTQAYRRYKQSVDAAEDRANVHFRKGFALVALQHYSLANKAFKRGLEIDRSLPVTGDSLNRIYGPDNGLAKTAFIHQVADWVGDDIRDPERLFLLGVLLHFDDDSERAGTVFEAGYRLAGVGDHFLAFLNPVEPIPVKPDLVDKKEGQQGPELPPLPVP